MTDKTKDEKKDGKKSSSGWNAADRLPLSVIPLSSTSLKSSSLVKNTRLETMLELHNDPLSGSLQIRPEEVPASFPNTSKGDQEIISKLATLNSYDVYSLRYSLQQLGIEVDKSVLELPQQMTARLDRYSLEFIRPLILHIFGEGGSEVRDGEGLQKLLQDPDVVRVQARLETMSQKIGIPVGGIPAFLQSYRDLFMSTLYYQENFESVTPDISRFWIWLTDLKTQREVTSSSGAMASCRRTMENLRFLFASTRERLARFRKEFEMFWGDMTPESFERLRLEIEDNRAAMGAVLCGLSVKMRDWSKAFPDNDAGVPSTRIKYVMSELEPGLENLTSIENDARRQLGMKTHKNSE